MATYKYVADVVFNCDAASVAQYQLTELVTIETTKFPKDVEPPSIDIPL